MGEGKDPQLTFKRPFEGKPEVEIKRILSQRLESFQTRVSENPYHLEWARNS